MPTFDSALVEKYRKIRARVSGGSTPEERATAARILAKLGTDNPGLIDEVNRLDREAAAPPPFPGFGGFPGGGAKKSGGGGFWSAFFEGIAAEADRQARERAARMGEEAARAAADAAGQAWDRVREATTDPDEAAVRAVPPERREVAKSIAYAMTRDVHVVLGRKGLGFSGSISKGALNRMLETLSDPEVVWWSRHLGRAIAESILAQLSDD